MSKNTHHPVIAGRVQINATFWYTPYLIEKNWNAWALTTCYESSCEELNFMQNILEILKTQLKTQ